MSAFWPRSDSGSWDQIGALFPEDEAARRAEGRAFCEEISYVRQRWRAKWGWRTPEASPRSGLVNMLLVPATGLCSGWGTHLADLGDRHAGQLAAGYHARALRGFHPRIGAGDRAAPPRSG